MPYFERKPYAETFPTAVSDAVEALSKADADVPIMDIAQTVLGQETLRHAEAQGPFRAKQAVAPGGVAAMVLSLSAPEGATAIALDLTATDLRGPGGARIPKEGVSLSPVHVVLSAAEPVDVRVEIQVPDEVPPGGYAGHIDGRGSDRLAIAIEMDVSPPPAS
ncbi:MAG: hypothetical protein WBC93_13230 [Sulfitobacter sp.]